jgi:hypothetical protein
MYAWTIFLNILFPDAEDESRNIWRCGVGGRHICMDTKSNDLYRGPTELVQHFAYRGNSHRRHGAARHIIDMVWLYSSPIPVGWSGGILLALMISTVFAATRRGGGSAPCGWIGINFTILRIMTVVPFTSAALKNNE